MTSFPAVYLLCALLGARQTAGLTTPPARLGVSQSPARLTVMRGETATLSCRFRAQSDKHGFKWFRMESGTELVSEPPRHIVQKENQSSSLLITEAAPEDSGKYFCEVSALYRWTERGSGTELTVLAPPSPPTLYLQTPADPMAEHFSLVCVTGGFYPSDLSLFWTNQSAASPIDRPSISRCTLSSASDPIPNPQCLQMVDLQTSEAYLLSVLPLPRRQALETGVTYTCAVEGHPAMTAPLNASYTWEAPPNPLIGALNVLKMCFLSAVAALFSLEVVSVRVIPKTIIKMVPTAVW